jgi:hypothetical protein
MSASLDLQEIIGCFSIFNIAGFCYRYTIIWKDIFGSRCSDSSASAYSRKP